MPKKLQEAVKKNVKKHRSQIRQKILSFVACILVFCLTYAVLLPALARRDAVIGEITSENLFEGVDKTVPTNKEDTNEEKEEWIDIFGDSKLTGIWRDDLLSIANSQLGYSESDRNFIISDAAGATKGYTRYGEWCGDPYGDWDAMFVAYCLNYARVKDMPLSVDCREWIDELDVTEDELKEAREDKQNDDLPTDRFFTPDEYTPVCGDLVFFDRTGDGEADHVGIVTELKKDENKKVTQITTIEGNSNDKVQNVIYSANDITIIGYAALPAQPPTYTFTDNGVEVVIMLPEGTEVPRDAVVKVTPIEAGDGSYKELSAQAESAVDGSVASIKLYDISFYTANGKYIPVGDRAQVSMRFDEAVVQNPSDLVVLHYDSNDSNPVALECAAVEEMTSAESEVTFETDGFSVFAVIELTSMYQTVEGIAGLENRSFIIAGVNNATGKNTDGTPNVLPVMTSVEVIDNGNSRLQKRQTNSFVYSDNKVTSVALTDYTNAVWTFEKAGTGTYYIRSSQGQYLSIPAREQLTLSDNKQEFRVIPATNLNANNGNVMNAVCIETDVGGTTYRVNLAANDANNNFTSWDEGSGTSDHGNHLVLVEYKEHPVTMPVVARNALNDLAGKKLVITNIGEYAITGNALTNADAFENRLAAEKVTAVAADQSTVTISSESSGNLVWEFEAAEAAGQYYIKHVATGKYLHIYDDNTGERYLKNMPLTLSDEKQPIEVLATDLNDSTVWIRFPEKLYTTDKNENNDNDYNAIDFYNAGAGFGVWSKGDVDKNATNNQFLLSEYTDLPMMDAFDPTVAANNLNGKTMVITVPTSNAVLTNNVVNDNGNSKLQAQQAAEENGIVGVAAGTELADVSWTFTYVPGMINQYYIQDSTGKYLNMDGKNVTLSADNKQPISVYDSGNGTVVFCVTGSDGKEYLLDMSARAFAFGAWNRAHGNPNDNNKFKLTPVEQFEQNSEVVTNLDGKTLGLISIYDLNPAGTTPKYAVTSDVDDSNKNALHGVAVELSGNTGKAYTFDDTKFTNNNELWTFEAAGDKLGVYHIKAANGKYLNIGENTAIVSDNPQEITVLTETINGEDGRTYDVVYLRVEVDGGYYYLSRDANGYDTDLFGRSKNEVTKAHRIVLAQPFTINIDVEKEGLNLNTDDWLYKPHFGNDWDSTRKEVADVDGTLPTSGELGAEPVENTSNGTSGVRHFVSFCFNESLDPYNDRGGKGRDFPQAYMASWAPGLDALDGTVDGYIDRTLISGEAFKAELKKNVYDPDDFKGESPYWGVEYELTHYEVILPDGTTMKDANGNVVKFAPGTSYKFNANGKVTIEDVNGKEYAVPSGSTFKAQYREFSDILTFYINLYGVVADISADIQPRYIEDFTLGLAIAHIYNPGQYAGDTDESYDDANDYINSLFKGAYGENVNPNVMHAVIDGFITRENTLDNEEGPYNPEYRDNDHVFNQEYPRYLSAKMRPDLGASAAALAAHVLDYVRNVPDIDIMLKKYVSGNGELTPTLNNQTIDTASFDVRWYVVKDQGDSWHIDGVMVGKTEPIPVTKTFYGLEKDAVESRVNYNSNNTVDNYQIGVTISSKVPVIYYNMLPYDQNYKESVIGKNEKGEVYCNDSNLNAAADGLYTYNGGSNPYSWTMSAILKQKYKLDEQNYDFYYTDENGNSQKYDRVSKVTVKDKDGNSTDTFGTSAFVTGGTTTGVEFNNYYTKHETGMFIVKKISSVTGLPLAGAVFTLTGGPGDGVNYTETTDADGEVSFYNLEVGTYTLTETKAPDGFAIGSEHVWTIKVENGGKVTYEGDKKLYEFKDDQDPIFEPLVITNAPAKTTVKVIKQFVGISKDQVDSLVENYSIVMKPTDNGNDETYTLKLTEYEGITPGVSADGLTYTWTLTNVPEIGYTVTESNFKLKNYVTTVSVEGFKDGDYTTSVTDPVVANDTATFDAIFNKDHEDGFTIYNSYANDFSMQITKVDSEDKKPLSGAEFKVYGAHSISTSPENVVVGDQTLYYLGTVTTDANGNATFNGWYDDKEVFHKLVLGYPYALVETKAPDGYNLLTEPIYLGVVEAEGVADLDKANPNLVFSNGVYSITVPNNPGYELPATGGPGTQLYTLGGLLLMAIPLMYGYKRKRVRKGGGNGVIPPPPEIRKSGSVSTNKNTL